MFKTVYDGIVWRRQKRRASKRSPAQGLGCDLRRSAWTLENEAIFGSNAFVAQFIWPLVKAQTLGYFDIPAFWRSAAPHQPPYSADSPPLRRRRKVATPKSFV